MMSGAELHANITETLLSGGFPRSAPDWIRIASWERCSFLGFSSSSDSTRCMGSE